MRGTTRMTSPGGPAGSAAKARAVGLAAAGRRAVPACAVALAAALAATAGAATLNGTVKVGGVVLDEVGDLSAIQETYNLYEGFALSQITLSGRLDAGRTFLLDLRDVNRPSRSGDLVFRAPGTLKLDAGYDQGRQVFDPARAVTSERRDWRLGGRFTPNPWLALSGQFGRVARDGDRLALPAGTASVLGTRYDNARVSGQLTAELRRDRRGAALAYGVSGFSDRITPAADRKGRVVSARLYSPSPFYDRWTHLVRGAYGVQELAGRSLDYSLASFEYTAVIQPREEYQLRYRFDASRVDHKSTRLRTDRFQNDVDGTWFHRRGRVTAGYGYETNDDDRTLTRYHSWRAGAAFRQGRRLAARADYAGRVKKDQEELTLLKDVESSQFRARLELEPLDRLAVGGGYTRRQRDLPDIRVTVDGAVTSAFVRFRVSGWGSLLADYSFSADEYRDRAGTFDTESHVVTARAEFDRITNLSLAGGFTYMDIGRDLDIEKSMVVLEGRFALLDRYHVEVAYNVYNYDDYILLDRYCTANVVRFNLGYDLRP